MLSWRERAPEYGGTRGIPSEKAKYYLVTDSEPVP